MSFPRVITGRTRTARLQGSFSLRGGFFIERITSTVVGAGGPGAFTEYSAVGFWTRASKVRARCGLWRQDPSSIDTSERAGFTFRLTPVIGVFPVAGDSDHVTIRAQMLLEIAGQTSTVILVQQITTGSDGLLLRGDGSNLAPHQIDWELEDDYDLFFNLREVADLSPQTFFSAAFGRNITAWPIQLHELLDTGSYIRVGDTTVPVTGTSPRFDPYSALVSGAATSGASIRFAGTPSAVNAAGGVLTTSISGSYTAGGWDMDAPSQAASTAAGSLTSTSCSTVAPTATTYGSYAALSFVSEWHPGGTTRFHAYLRAFGSPALPATIQLLGSPTVVSPTVIASASGSDLARDFADVDYYLSAFIAQTFHNTAGGGQVFDSEYNHSFTDGDFQRYGLLTLGQTGLLASARLLQADANSLGESELPDLWGQGWKWPALAVDQAAITTLEASPFTIGGPTGWANVTPAAGHAAPSVTLSAVGGNLRLTVGSVPAPSPGIITTTTGTAARNLVRDLCLRYPVIRIRTVGKAHQPFTVNGMGSGQTGADGTFVNVTLDLALPPSSPQVANGVLSPSDLVLSGLAADTVYEIKTITLQRFESSLLHPLQQPVRNTHGLDSPPIGNYTALMVNTALTGTTDGALSLRATSGTLGGLSTRIERGTGTGVAPWRGWTATILNPARAGKPSLTTILSGSAGVAVEVPWSDFADGDASSVHLWGAGMLEGTDGPDVPPVPGIDLELPQTIPARFAFIDGVSGYPGMGDVFGYSGGAFGRIYPLVFGKLLRGGVYGVVVDSTETAGQPRAGDALTVKLTEDAGGAEEGTGDTSPYGYFHTGAPYGEQGPTPGSGPLHTATLQVPGTPTESLPAAHMRLLNGLRTYISLLYVPGSRKRYPTNLSHKLGYYARSFVNAGGDLIFQRTVKGVPSVSNPYKATVTVTATGGMDRYPCLSLLPNGRLLLSFVRQRGTGTDGFDVFECFSDSDGGSWSEPAMSIPNGRNQRMATTKMGTLRLAFVKGTGATGTLRGTFATPANGPAGTAFTLQEFKSGALIDLAVEEDTLDIKLMAEGPARWILTCRPAGESDPADFVNASDGKTWARL